MSLSASTDTVAPQQRSAGIGFIMVTVLIDMVSIGLIIPVLPALIGSFTHSAAEQAYWCGVVAFAFSIASFVGAPVLGALSDRYGRRPILLLGFCGLALNFIVTGLATSLGALVAVRLIGGAMQANVAVANAYVADITAPQDRARRFGMLGAMFGVGFILGPVSGGLLGEVNLHLPFFVAGGLSIINLLYGYFVLPESLPAERRTPVNWRSANPVSALRKLLDLRGGGVLVVMIGLCSLAQFTMHSTWVLYTGFRFGWGPAQNGYSLFAVGLLSTIVQGFLLKHFIARLGTRRMVVLGVSSGALAYLLWGFALEGWMMYAVIFCNVLAFGATAALQSLISNATAAEHQGQTLGAVSSLNSLMAVIAPIIGPTLLGQVAHYQPHDLRVGLPFYFCAVLQGVAALLAVRYVATHHSDQPVARPLAASLSDSAEP